MFLNLSGGKKSIKVPNSEGGGETVLTVDQEFPDDEKRDTYVAEIRDFANAVDAPHVPFGLAANKSDALNALEDRREGRYHRHRLLSHARRRPARGASRKQADLTEEKVAEILKTVEAGDYRPEIARWPLRQRASGRRVNRQRHELVNSNRRPLRATDAASSQFQEPLQEWPKRFLGIEHPGVVAALEDGIGAGFGANAIAVAFRIGTLIRDHGSASRSFIARKSRNQDLAGGMLAPGRFVRGQTACSRIASPEVRNMLRVPVQVADAAFGSLQIFGGRGKRPAAAGGASRRAPGTRAGSMPK